MSILAFALLVAAVAAIYSTAMWAIAASTLTEERAAHDATHLALADERAGHERVCRMLLTQRSAPRRSA